MRSGRSLLTTVAFALLAVLVAWDSALAAKARVRWRKLADPRVAGYRVYHRDAGSMRPTRVFSGLPVADAAGVMSHEVPVPSLDQLQYFAVTAYTSNGQEGWFERELSLGPPEDACVTDRCFNPTLCELVRRPDGFPCGTNVENPCSGVCRRGACGASVDSSLMTRRINLAFNGERARFTARGELLPRSDVDPIADGAFFRIGDRDGKTIFSALVPPGVLTTNRRETSFRFRSPRQSISGLRRLSLIRSRDGTMRVNVRGVASPAEVPESGQLTWSLVVGDDCGTDTGLSCVAGETRVRCSDASSRR